MMLGKKRRTEQALADATRGSLEVSAQLVGKIQELAELQATTGAAVARLGGVTQAHAQVLHGLVRLLILKGITIAELDAAMTTPVPELDAALEAAAEALGRRPA